jgi:glycosyltransferase involved in cell wall biosynthesis
VIFFILFVPNQTALYIEEKHIFAQNLIKYCPNMSKRKKKIIVSVTNDLVSDQRVHKVCATLLQNGYHVTLIGRRMRNSQPLNRAYNIYRMRLLFRRSFFFYAEYNVRLFLYLLFHTTDAYLSNDTDTLPANYLASVIRRKPLIFDAHELFPEVPEVTNRKWIKAFWTKIEDSLFPHLKYSYTVCQSIADVYNQKYGINMQTVRNIPPRKIPSLPQQIMIDKQEKKMILYQGAVNKSRGIEYIIDAMEYLDGFIFYVVGGGDLLKELQESVRKRNLQDKVVFTGKIPFEQLPAYTVCADIGVNLLENNGLNYYYSLPNRIFDYMRMNIPVLSCDFPEIRKIVAHYGVGTLVDNYSPSFLAKTIQEMSKQGKNKTGFSFANAALTWENEAIVLLKIVREAMADK